MHFAIKTSFLSSIATISRPCSSHLVLVALAIVGLPPQLSTCLLGDLPLPTPSKLISMFFLLLPLYNSNPLPLLVMIICGPPTSYVTLRHN